VHQGNSEGPKVTHWFAEIRNYLAEVRREMKDVNSLRRACLVA